ncbi:MAG: dihydrolipoyl dehydrogenase [Varibaculum sp.]|nr:dihydrolipoyl dehydrogenase [Varibaculum sp.]
MSEYNYDVVIMGAGSGGYATALRSAQLGKKVALIEGDKIGGTCLHRGCIPTKALLHVAEVAEDVRSCEAIGIQASLNGFDTQRIAAFRDGTIKRLYRGLQGLIKSRRIEVVTGWGRLTDAHTVTVEGVAYTGENIVLATGSYSKTLPGLTIEGRVITSEQALQLDWIPQRAAVLGGGVIGVEFASYWRSMGSEVTIIEGLPSLVPNEDSAIRKVLEKDFRKRGIAFHTGTFFESVTQDDSGVHIKAGEVSVDADLLLVAVGRGPQTANMGYEEVGVNMDRGFVLTDEQLRTNIPSVFAVGDIVPGVQLAHRGFAQGVFLAEKLAGLSPEPIRDSNIPKVTFCEPQIASVGLNQDQAEEQYGAQNVRVMEYNLAGNGKTQILGGGGLIKLVAVNDGPIVGFHAIGSRVGELVGEGQLMVNWEAYPDDLAALVHAHPTQNEAIGEAAMALAGKPLHS